MASHHMTKTPSTENPNPKNPTRDLNPKPKPKTPYHHEWAKKRKNVKNNPGNKYSKNLRPIFAIALFNILAKFTIRFQLGQIVPQLISQIL